MCLYTYQTQPLYICEGRPRRRRFLFSHYIFTFCCDVYKQICQISITMYVCIAYIHTRLIKDPLVIDCDTRLQNEKEKIYTRKNVNKCMNPIYIQQELVFNKSTKAVVSFWYTFILVWMLCVVWFEGLELYMYIGIKCVIVNLLCNVKMQLSV